MKKFLEEKNKPLSLRQKFNASVTGIVLCSTVLLSICLQYEKEWFRYLKCKGEYEVVEAEVIEVNTEKVGERAWADFTLVRSKAHGDAKIPSDLRDKPGKIILLGATKEKYVVRLSPVIPPWIDSITAVGLIVALIFFIYQFFRLYSKCRLEEAQEQAKEYAQMSQNDYVKSNNDFKNYKNTVNQNDYQNQNDFTDQNDHLNQNVSDDPNDIYKS